VWCVCGVGLMRFLGEKYPGFADRIHEGLVDIFGEKGRCAFLCFYFPLSFPKLEDGMTRNIVTHHAEDGSGVGSAIIAGMFVFLSFASRKLILVQTAMTQARREGALDPHV
jgi:hexokinase